MPTKPVVRKFFAGGNTAYGFYSLFDNILEEDSKRLVILKGGPGTGKSTIFKSIGVEMLKKGFAVEYFYCSSDSASLDGVAIPALKAAVVDGTAPHVIDPVVPGARDEIVNLGDYWDEAVLIPQRERLIHLGRIIKSHFSEAYYHLAEGKMILDHLKSHTAAIMDFSSLNAATCHLMDKLLARENQRGEISRERHLFGSAITPTGIVDHYSSILSGCVDLYVLKGAPGTGKSTLLEKIYRGFLQKGLEIEVYHCSFDPQKIEALVVPEKQLGFLRLTDQLKFSSSATQENKNQTVLNLEEFYLPLPCRKEIMLQTEDRKSFAISLEKAISYIKKAKLAHTEREKYYYQAMDFEQVDEVREKIVAKLLSI